MNINFNPEDAVEYITSDILPLWVATRDHEKECIANGKYFDPNIIKEFDDILEAFYEKRFQDGLSKYIYWAQRENIKIPPKDIYLLKAYAKYLNMNIDIFNIISSLEEK